MCFPCSHRTKPSSCPPSAPGSWAPAQGPPNGWEMSSSRDARDCYSKWVCCAFSAALVADVSKASVWLIPGRSLPNTDSVLAALNTCERESGAASVCSKRLSLTGWTQHICMPDRASAFWSDKQTLILLFLYTTDLRSDRSEDEESDMRSHTLWVFCDTEHARIWHFEIS